MVRAYFFAFVVAFVCKTQAVFSLVEPAGDVYALPGDLMDANEWVRVFLQTGGMQHLLALLGRDGGIDPSQVITDVNIWYLRSTVLWYLIAAVLVKSELSV